MPVLIPLIAAAASIAGGVAIGGAAIAAGTLTASAVIGGLMIAGGVLSAAGAITGNQRLGRLGGILSLAGGVGALGQAVAGQIAGQVAASSTLDGAGGMALQEGATPASLTSQTAAQTAAPAANAATPPPSEDAVSSPVSPGDVPPIQSGPDGAGGMGMQEGPTPKSLIADSQTAGPPGNTVDTAAQSTTVDHGEDYGKRVDGPFKPLVQGASTTPAIQPPSVTENPLTYDQQRGMLNMEGPSPASVTDPEPTPLQKVGGVIKDVSGWMNKNPELSKVGGGIVQGSMSNAAKQRLLQQQYQLEWEQEQKRRAQFNASIHGLGVPSYVPPKG